MNGVFKRLRGCLSAADEATGALIRQYIWLEGAPVAVIEGGVIHFVRSDHISRPAFATNISATVTWRVSYLPFGGVRTTVGTPPTARFPGQWFQSETALHQNWMRDYDPTTGRYIQADPLGLVDGASVYAYARQNPGRWTDPTGEFVPQAVACLVNPWCRTAAGAALGILAGYIWDDDTCYTWEDFIFDGIHGGFAGWSIGKGVAPVFDRSGPCRRGGWWSTGRNWRLGWNRNGGNLVFRWADRSGRHRDWYDGGPL